MTPKIVSWGTSANGWLVNADDMLRTNDRVVFFGGVCLGEIREGQGEHVVGWEEDPVTIPGDPTKHVIQVIHIYEDEDGNYCSVAGADPHPTVEIPHQVENLQFWPPTNLGVSYEAAQAMLRVVGRSMIVKLSSKWNTKLGRRDHEWEVSPDGRTPLSHRDLHLAFFWDSMMAHEQSFADMASFLSGFPWWEDCSAEAVRTAAKRLGLKKRKPRQPDVWEK